MNEVKKVVGEMGKVESLCNRLECGRLSAEEYEATLAELKREVCKMVGGRPFPIAGGEDSK